VSTETTTEHTVRHTCDRCGKTTVGRSTSQAHARAEATEGCAAIGVKEWQRGALGATEEMGLCKPCFAAFWSWYEGATLPEPLRDADD